MKITVIGTGYVGLIAGLGFANFGNNVVCVDTDVNKIEMLQNGIAPIYEQGAEELLRNSLRSGTIRFTTDKKAAIEHGELIFIAVGTPESDTGEADLSQVFVCAQDIAEYMQEYKLIVDKSTVPIGTARKVYLYIENRQKEMGKSIPFSVASNPEFLREGKAIQDFLNPDRIIIGVSGEKEERLLRQLYGVFNRSQKPVLVTTVETAEMIKYASNAFLATKIAFINEIANLCEKTGANVQQVAYAMGKDGRISPKFLHVGPGFGGSCFPKDTKALASIGRQNGSPLTIVESVITSNKKQKQLAADKILKAMPEGGTLAVLGLSYKPDTDDVRESPAIEILKILQTYNKFRFRLFDPKAMPEAQKTLCGLTENEVVWCKSTNEAVGDCDAVAIMTEWAQFSVCDWKDNRDKIRKHIFFDLRNMFLPEQMREWGYTYYGTGVDNCQCY